MGILISDFSGSIELLFETVSVFGIGEKYFRVLTNHPKRLVEIRLIVSGKFGLFWRENLRNFNEY
jgi:hypothetical protein